MGKEFISEYAGSTVRMGPRKMEVYYRANDQDTTILIKEFDYGINEEIESIRQDVWKT